MTSVGYLVAASAATVIGLVGYVYMLVQWTREARVRNARLKTETEGDERKAI
jgi:hypothetical protein